jgi:O-antigen/teichoic acid export membrane protein
LATSSESTITREKKKDSGSSFATDVFTLVSGTAIAQIISIASAPLITRIYGADAFGLLAVFTSLVSMIAVIACLRYELAIMLPKADKEAVNLLALSLLITTFISLTLVPIIWLFGDEITSILNTPGLQPYMWLVSPMVFLTGSFSAINYWNSRKKQFGHLSKTQIAKAATTSGTQLGAGCAGYVSGGALIGAGFVGQLIATSTLSYRAWKMDKVLFRNNISWKEMKVGSVRYRDFPRYDIWSALLNVITLQMPIFVLSAFFTSTIVGYYSLGFMVLQLPSSFVGAAIGQVFFQRAAEAKHESKAQLTSVVGSTAKRLILLGFPIILLLSIIGKEAFIVFFGPNWAEAGVYSQILSFWILISFVTSPLSTLLSVLAKLKPVLFINIAILIIRTGALAIGGIYHDVYLSLMLFTVTGGIIYLLFGWWIILESGVSLSGLFRSISKYLVMGLLSLSIVVFIMHIFVLNPLASVMLGVICILPYYLFLSYSDNEIKAFFSQLFRRDDFI